MEHSAATVSYLAEEQLVSIVPRQSMDSITLIGRSMPALRPLVRQEVPLWLALLLKRHGKCSIVAPAWLDIENLKHIYEQEQANRNRFSELPEHWIETSELLLNEAADDISSEPHTIRALLQDLKEIRQSKAREGMGQLTSSYIQLDNLGRMEIHELRGFMTGIMRQLHKLDSFIEQPTSDYEDD
ncbi:hypothetical protein CANCADRAFT_128017 [Tortispora caseinolytica NRRL Y-17796]|uniref:DNA replication complex GINS protein PSF2 n=1 Tax=Tortispora caseinolytica NRRL Y-17796 TaxID=767744 RepID=A0A1E4TAC6_9ASCO|nr:hypothetical protein CANCADRAFT_128017 [Tortispora caseinolytica NRRL Y-17796]